jgi:hypothetical protein
VKIIGGRKRPHFSGIETKRETSTGRFGANSSRYDFARFSEVLFPLTDAHERRVGRAERPIFRGAVQRTQKREFSTQSAMKRRSTEPPESSTISAPIRRWRGMASSDTRRRFALNNRQSRIIEPPFLELCMDQIFPETDHDLTLEVGTLPLTLAINTKSLFPKAAACAVLVVV